MGALYQTPELFETYVTVARSHRLPFLHCIEQPAPANVALRTPADIVPDAVVMATEPASPAQWMEFYISAVCNLKPGLTEFLLHLGHDDAELRAVTVGWDAFGSRWRQQDYDALTSAEFGQALKENGVVLVTWREIQRAMYPLP